jgi:hypothetical protein
MAGKTGHDNSRHTSERACNDLESLFFCFSYWAGDYFHWGASVLLFCEKEEHITKISQYVK